MKKRKWISVLMAVVLLLQVLSPLGALADGTAPGKNGTGPAFPPGGAAYDPTIPVPREQVKVLQAKLEMVKKIQELIDAGYSVKEIRDIMHMPRLFPYAKGSDLAGRGDDSAWCYMQIWKEPETQPNWCGPGSGKAVLSNFLANPPSMEYLAKEAPRACHPKYDGNATHCYGMFIPSIQKTLAVDWTSIVNDQIGGYYAMTNPNGLDAYKNYLKWDISWNGHPVNNIVNTEGLPGWGTWSTDHYLAANQYIFSSDWIHYGDTAPNSASPNGNPFGWHWWPLSSFYSTNVVGAYNLIIW